MSNSWQFHGLQHTRLPCLSLSLRVCSNSCPLSGWCYTIISSSTTLFSFCFQTFLASEPFPMSQLFSWGGQSIGDSALASVLPKNTQGWSPSEWTGWISLQSKGLSRVFSNTAVQKHQFFGAQPSSRSNSNIHTWPQEKLPVKHMGLLGWVLLSPTGSLGMWAITCSGHRTNEQNEMK